MNTEELKQAGWLSPDESAKREELHTMQLVAIMTASMQNTESTVKDRIDRSNPYWTQAYEDVCVAIDREMKHLAEAAKLQAQLSEADWIIDNAMSNNICMVPVEFMERRDKWLEERKKQ